ncbi:MurR/RpiR family transcriptional regulator [Granulicatella seriolae]|uniref:MurR/RpiR family transcriptional regulator n=1 Tax=Granulicatella seriolae TaxID=2967226 RepID=A0ABT1WMD1_9LACT|nr:MurR/RpiR family transcriptional regulator [Granulicatella seriolae]
MNSDMLRRIRSLLDELPNSQRVIAQYILDNPVEVTGMTVQELAKSANSSSTSVMRFLQSLQVSSFPQLKVQLASSLSKEELATTDILPNESLGSIKEKLLLSASQLMNDTINFLSDQIIEEVVNLIERASIIYVFGVGASYLVAENIAQKWNRVGKITICLQDTHVLATTLASKSDQAIFIGISNSGNTKEVVQVLKLAKSRGLKTVAITQFGHNALSNEADYSLQTVKSNESVIRSAATSSLHSQFITIDVLFYYYMSKHYKESVAYVKDTHRVIRELENG